METGDRYKRRPHNSARVPYFFLTGTIERSTHRAIDPYQKRSIDEVSYQVTAHDIKFLVTVINTTQCVEDIWYVSLYPTFNSIPAILRNTLSKDVFLLAVWTGTWKVPAILRNTLSKDVFLFGSVDRDMEGTWMQESLSI